MNYPESYRYTKEHEWVRVDGDVATVGITHFAQNAIGDVVFVDLPKPGLKVAQMQQFGTVESVKTVSEIFAPADGSVADVNSGLTDHPEQVNDDPYGKGWMLKIKLSGSLPADLLDAPAYEALVGSESH